MGCGKTTIGSLLAKKLQWSFKDGDDYHPPSNISKMREGIPLNDADRMPWLDLLHEMIRDAVKQNRHLVLACSALKKSYRDRLGIDQNNVISVYLKGSFELLQERVQVRFHQYMPKELLRSQLETLEAPTSGIIVSIDAKPEEITKKIISLLPAADNTR
jgi:carbohydrate kinase (thermoresistant glucokinase family)